MNQSKNMRLFQSDYQQFKQWCNSSEKNKQQQIKLYKDRMEKTILEDEEVGKYYLNICDKRCIPGSGDIGLEIAYKTFPNIQSYLFMCEMKRLISNEKDIFPEIKVLLKNFYIEQPVAEDSNRLATLKKIKGVKNLELNKIFENKSLFFSRLPNEVNQNIKNFDLNKLDKTINDTKINSKIFK